MILFSFILIGIFKLYQCDVNETCISSVNLFPDLDFTVPKHQRCFLWDKEMEINYLTGLQNWKNMPLKVFVVPFSHNDAGWIYTFEEYFDRSSRDIMDNVANTLPILEHFTFVWSEICFLERWWTRAGLTSKKKLLDSIKSGQLEIVTGSWVMPDEATTTVFALLDQLIEGSQWVYSKLGITVETSWSIDQFGVGSTWPYLLAESGIKLTVVQRVHWAWKRYLAKNQLTDMIWRKDEDDSSGEIRLKVQTTPSYALTSSCGPDKSICVQFDFNPEISEALPIKFDNIRQRVETLLGQYGRLGASSAENVALITLGTDFRYENRSEWYSQYYNYKAIMDYVSSNFELYHTGIQFGTLKDFLHQTKAPTVKFVGDFFVYSDLGPDKVAVDDYWSGYFSTRPYWKLLGRKLESALRTAETLYSFCHVRVIASASSDVTHLMRTSYTKLVYCRRVLGLFQHHDAITGTSNAKVMTDYERKLRRGIRYSKELQVILVSLLCTGLKDYGGMARVTRSKVVNEFPSLVTVFNSLMTERSEVISIQVSDTDLLVLDLQNNDTVPHQVNFCNTEDEFELVFIPSLKPLSLSSFLITKDSCGSHSLSKVYKLVPQESEFNFAVKTSVLALIFSSETGMLSGLLTHNKEKIPLDISVMAYESTPTRSGAYLFRPEPDIFKLNVSLESKNIYVLEGPLYKDVVTNYGSTFSIRTRIYQHSGLLGEIVEVTTVTDFGPVTENGDMELFLRVSSDLQGCRFFTDVNGFNYRERKTIREMEVAGNYYPMTEEAYLENNVMRLSIFSDHSHGVASLRPGEMEVMLDRRIMQDDRRGMDEGVMDVKRAKSRFFIHLKNSDTSESCSLKLSLLLNHEAPVFLPEKDLKVDIGTLISQPLPPNIHLLNLKTLPSQDGSPADIILMTLLRKSSLDSHSNNDAFLPDTYFYHMDPVTISRTLLTGIYEFETFVNLNEIQIKPFSIVSVKLFYGNI